MDTSLNRRVRSTRFCPVGFRSCPVPSSTSQVVLVRCHDRSGSPLARFRFTLFRSGYSPYGSGHVRLPLLHVRLPRSGVLTGPVHLQYGSSPLIFVRLRPFCTLPSPRRVWTRPVIIRMSGLSYSLPKLSPYRSDPLLSCLVSSHSRSDPVRSASFSTHLVSMTGLPMSGPVGLYPEVVRTSECKHPAVSASTCAVELLHLGQSDCNPYLAVVPSHQTLFGFTPI